VKRKRGLTAKVQYRREMILGYDEDASDDDTDHPQSNQAHLTLSELRTYGLGLARGGGSAYSPSDRIDTAEFGRPTKPAT
jgi:hypothetical protein